MQCDVLRNLYVVIKDVDAYIDFASVAAHINSPRKKTTGMHPFREMREGAVR